MRESTLMKMSLIMSILGFVGIFLIVSHASYDYTDIGSISVNMVGETVNFTGMVSGSYVHESGHVFLDVFDETGEIKVVIWSDTAKFINETITRGNFVRIIGNVKLYNGDIEIIARRITVLA